MQAFKLFFRIVAKNKSTFLIYLGAFLLITVLFVAFSGSQPEEGFESSKVLLAIENKDAGAVGRGIESYLREMTSPVDLAQNESARLDALYFGETDYILTIPEDFTQRFLAGENDPGLERRVGHDVMPQVQVELLIGRYLRLASLYRDGLPGISEEDLARRVRDGLREQADTKMLSSPVSQGHSLIFYLRYYAYATLSILILCISSVMLSVSRPEIRQRSAASPVPMTRQILQLILGSLLLALALWAILVGAGLAVFGKGTHPAVIRLILYNTLVHTLVCLCLSFALSTLITSHTVQSAVSNVVTLSASFLSGVFVPQSLLGNQVQRIASFLPTHWYVRAIDALSPGLAPGATALAYSRESVLIQLGFCAAFLALALLGAKRRGLAETGR